MAVSFLARRPGDGPASSTRRARSKPSRCFFLVVAYVIACRAQFEIADGYTVPTELVLVPMLFLLPTPVGAAGRQRQLGAGAAARLRHAAAPASTAPSTSSATAGTRSGPALVLVVAGAQVFSWDDWPIYVVALLAQFGFDFAATSLRAGLIDGTSPRESLRLMAPGLRARRRPGADRPARDLRGDLGRAGRACW